MSEGEEVAEEVETPTSLTIYDVVRLSKAWINSGKDGFVSSIDLSEVESIDASGVQFLLHLQSTLSTIDEPFLLNNPSEEVVKTFSLLNVDRLLNKNLDADEVKDDQGAAEEPGSES